MKRGLSTTLLFLVMAAAMTACSHRAGVDRPSTQDNFGVQMAKSNLWREAMFRFKRAVELDPSNATAHNNLAVAYEANGDFDLAAKEYREALRLDRTNQYIQKNYSRYTEFLSRNKKRGAKDGKAAAATAAPGSSRPSGVTSGPGSGPSAGGPVSAATPGSPGSAEPMTPPSSAPPPATQQPPPTPPPTTANAPGGSR